MTWKITDKIAELENALMHAESFLFNFLVVTSRVIWSIIFQVHAFPALRLGPSFSGLENSALADKHSCLHCVGLRWSMV